MDAEGGRMESVNANRMNILVHMIIMMVAYSSAFIIPSRLNIASLVDD